MNFRLIGVEWMKTRTRWLPWVLLIVMALGTGVQIWLFGYTAWWDLHNENDPELRADLPLAIRTFTLPWAIPALLDTGQYWGSVIIGVLIASVVATEYNWGTVRHAIARGQSRSQFLTVKLLGLASFSALLLLIVFAWGIVSMIWTSSLAGYDVTLDPPGAASMTFADIIVAMLRAGMGILPYALLAFALTTVGRSTALGATGIILFIIIESTIIGIFDALGGIWEDLLVFSIGQNATALIAANKIDDGDYASLAFRSVPDASELPDPWMAFAVLCTWSVLLVAFTFWVFGKRDLRLGTGE